MWSRITSRLFGVNKETLGFLKERLENRNYSITHKSYPVEFGNMAAVNKEKIIVIEPKKINDSAVKRLYAQQIHESAHILFSSVDFDRCEKTIRNNKLNKMRARHVLNIIEDYRVNTLISQTHPGAGRLMHKIHQGIVDKKTYKTAIEGILPQLCGYKTKTDLSETEQKKFDTAIELIKPVVKSRNLDASLEVLPKVYEVFYPEEEEPDEETGMGSGGSESLDEEIKKIEHELGLSHYEKLPDDAIYPESKDDVESSLPKSKVKKNVKEAVEKLLKKLDEETGVFVPGSSKYSEEEEDLEKLCSEVKKIQEQVSKETEKEFSELEEIEKSSDQKESSRHGEFIYKVEHHIENNFHKSTYNIEVSGNKTHINKLVNEMKKFMVFNRRWTNGQRTGKLNSRKAYRVLTNGDTDVFRKKSQKEVGDIAILLLVDCSGSMSDRSSGRKARYEYARECSIVLHEVLRRLKIKHMIVGFTADEKKETMTHLDGKMEHIRSTDHIVFKTWNDNAVAYNLSEIIYIRNNRDGHSIRTAIKYFDKRKEHKKLMIVISDGAPAANGYINGLEDTVKAQEETVKKGIKLVNIGIGRGFHIPKNYINKVKVDDVSTLPDVLLRTLKREMMR